MAQHPVLRNQRGGGVLSEHVTAVDAGARREEGRQTRGVLRVEQAVGATLGDRRQLGQGDGHEVEREGQRLSVEVARRHHLPGVGKDDRIVHHRSQLASEHLPRKGQRVAGRPVHLGGAAQAVGILDGVDEVVPVAGADLGTLDEAGDVGRRDDLPGVRPQAVDLGAERAGGTHQRFHRQRAGKVGGTSDAKRPLVAEGPERQHSLGAVEQAEALLGPQVDGSQPVPLQYLAGVGHPSFILEKALSDEGQRQMGEGGEIARGAHRALAGHHRQ